MSEPERRTLTPKDLIAARFLSAEDFRADSGSGEWAAETMPRRIGDYEVVGEVARGGMGVVYRARDPDLEREVAIKRILGAFSVKGLERFLREGRAAAQLRHPHIVTTHHVGHEPAGPYLVMELIDGPSLEERLKDGPLEVREAVHVAQRIAGALAYAHDRGVLHRDLKPANLLLRADGEPVLMDFGLAKPLDEEGGPTASGQAVGTPSYMSPEQADGVGVDVRSDVYGLGATLYQLLTGEPPVQGTSLPDTLRRVATAEPPAPSRLRPEVDRDLETLVLRCLEKDPVHRYPTARELGDDLRRYLDGDPILARPPSLLRRARRRASPHLVPVAGAALAAIALWGLGTGQASNRWARADQLMTRAELSSADQGREAVEPLVEQALALDDATELRERGALVLERVGALGRARELLEAAIAAEPPGYRSLFKLHSLELAERPPVERGFRMSEPLRRLREAARDRGETNLYTAWIDGKLALERGEMRAAVAHLTVAIDGGMEGVHLDRGVAYKRMREDALARRDLLSAHRQDARHPWPPYNLALLEYEAGELGLAHEYLNRTLALDGRFAPAQCHRGLVRLGQDDWVGAREDFEATIALDPTGARFPRSTFTAELWLLQMDLAEGR